MHIHTLENEYIIINLINKQKENDAKFMRHAGRNHFKMYAAAAAATRMQCSVTSTVRKRFSQQQPGRPHGPSAQFRRPGRRSETHKTNSRNVSATEPLWSGVKEGQMQGSSGAPVCGGEQRSCPLGELCRVWRGHRCRDVFVTVSKAVENAPATCLTATGFGAFLLTAIVQPFQP